MKAEDLKVNRAVIFDKRMISTGNGEDIIAKGNVYKKTNDSFGNNDTGIIDIELDTGYSIRLFFEEEVK